MSLRQWNQTGGLGACLAILCLLAAPCGAHEHPSEALVIPNPASVEKAEGAFELSRTTAIIAPTGDAAAMRVAQFLSQLLTRTHGVSLPVRTGTPSDGAINFVRESRGKGGEESYRLSSSPQRVTIAAPATGGLRYGAITLSQLVVTSSGKTVVPAWRIDDAPRFAWRGVMLDSARHFQSPEFIRQYIDWMALHKLNVLHWHLTDDQAWRLEIKRYPALTGVAAWRVPAGAAAQADIDPATRKARQYGGFYSQETVKALVKHAADRGVTIVPEIEMPGHATATLAAYPQLGSTPNPPLHAPADWGIYPNVYSPEDGTFEFLQNVLTEVMALFPGKFIHIGGDEVDKHQWTESPAGQRRMQALGIKDAAGLQTYFTQRIGRFLHKHGRRLVGWDEVLEPGLPAAAVVMSWRGIDGALAAAQKGFDTVLSPWPTLYFDNLQRLSPDEPPGRGRVITLQDVYAFEPMPEKLTFDQRKHVLGLQGNVWTEHIRTEERAASMTFPRAAAVAELGWSQPERRSWTGFTHRLAAQVGRYQQLKLPYSDSAFAVNAESRYQAGTAVITLSTQAAVGEIRYTTDGLDPSPNSPIYAAPLTLQLPASLRAAAFAGEQALSRPRSFGLSRDAALRRSSQELKLCSENIALSLEDDAPREGRRAAFLMDIQNPCWIFPQVELDKVRTVTAAVGQVPFNFQIGELVKQIKFSSPQTAEGELEVHLDDCKGEVLARLPLKPALASQAVTTLPPEALETRSGRHDVCIKFAQHFSDWTRDPIWALDWIQFSERAGAAP